MTGNWVCMVVAHEIARTHTHTHTHARTHVRSHVYVFVFVCTALLTKVTIVETALPPLQRKWKHIRSTQNVCTHVYITLSIASENASTALKTRCKSALLPRIEPNRCFINAAASSSLGGEAARSFAPAIMSRKTPIAMGRLTSIGASETSSFPCQKYQ